MRKEARLVRRYLGEIREWKGVLWGAFVTAVLGGLFAALSRVSPSLLHFLPEFFKPWLTSKSRLYAVALIGGASLVQYLAWRKLRLALDGVRPEIGKGLKLLKTQAMPQEPSLYAEITVTRETVGRRRLRLRVSKAITKGRANVGDLVGRLEYETETVGYMDFDGEKAPIGTLIKLFVWGHEQPILQGVEITDPP